MSKRHHFIESSSAHGDYERVIYCTACGMVVWNWNSNDCTKPSIMDYQSKVGQPCIEATALSSEHQSLPKASTNNQPQG